MPMTDKSAEAPAPETVESLRAKGHWGSAKILEQADTITRLTAEVERLKEGRETMGNLWAKERAARVAAEAEVGWLEAARAPEMADEITNLRAAISKLESELASALTDLNTARQDNGSFGPEFKRLTAEVERLKSGYQGACYACEPVGELNQSLTAEVERLRAWIQEVADDPYSDREGIRASARAALQEPRT
jgi:chromosome segregation ATPase